MNVLVVGLGVIGTTYGLVFKQAGHNVEHYIREGSRKRDVKCLSVFLLDGRKTSEGIEKNKRIYGTGMLKTNVWHNRY